MYERTTYRVNVHMPSENLFSSRFPACQTMVPIDAKASAAELSGKSCLVYHVDQGVSYSLRDTMVRSGPRSGLATIGI